jgi:hypothetical protein
MNDTLASLGDFLTIESVPGCGVHSEDLYLRGAKDDFLVRGPRSDDENSLLDG